MSNHYKHFVITNCMFNSFNILGDKNLSFIKFEDKESCYVMENHNF